MCWEVGGEGPDGSRTKVSANKEMLLPKLFSDHRHKTRANLKLVIIGITLRDAVKDWEVGGGEKGAPYPEEIDMEPLT